MNPMTTVSLDIYVYVILWLVEIAEENRKHMQNKSSILLPFINARIVYGRLAKLHNTNNKR